MQYPLYLCFSTKIFCQYHRKVFWGWWMFYWNVSGMRMSKSGKWLPRRFLGWLGAHNGRRLSHWRCDNLLSYASDTLIWCFLSFYPPAESVHNACPKDYSSSTPRSYLCWGFTKTSLCDLGTLCAHGNNALLCRILVTSIDRRFLPSFASFPICWWTF
jgi:hypothetical protein